MVPCGGGSRRRRGPEIPAMPSISPAAPKRLLTIQDVSCVGQCSATVALPLVSACGVECAVLPSAVLSNHTGGFPSWTFRDLTDEMVDGQVNAYAQRGGHYDKVESYQEGDMTKGHLAELDEDGNPTGKTLLTNVFSQFGFEETGEYYHFDDKDGQQQAVKMKQPWIDVKINPDVATWAFDMSQGYVNHLELIASYSTKRPTPRLYLMLMNRTKKGEKMVTIPLTELKEYLGIMPYKDEHGNTVVPYPKFANFRQKVLDAVQADLERMAAQDPPKTDITFTYEPVYPGTRKKGDPEAICFHVERTILGDAYNVVVNHKPSELLDKQPVQQEMFADEYQKTWQRCIDEICEMVKDDAVRQRFRSIKLESFTKETNTLLMQIPDSQFHEWLESDKVLQFFYGYVVKHFGKGLKLKYRLMAKG